MKEYPNAKLTLTGCNSDEGVEKGDSGLSRSRAETIQDYLLNVWKVSPGRITLTSQNLPNVPSNPKTLEGKEENRRVEITSNEPAVTELF
ncbi:MAG: OmpA family protein, partial [Candidatus Kapaibacterium sp.]